MLINDLTAACWTATLVSSCAIGAVLVLRRALRLLFGAGPTYLAWAAVPIAMLAAWLPEQRAAAGESLSIALTFQTLSTVAQATVKQAAAFANVPTWLAVWAVGSLVFACSFIAAHRRLVRALGSLKLSDLRDVHLTHESRLAPLALGLLQPRIVLPEDFATRYTTRELDLILTHERVHIRRHDPVANLLCALAQCIFWFNPLVHYAARRFRIDQELSCDAAVLRMHPNACRTYAEAIYKTQQASAHVTALCCHWQLVHPIKERILNLKQSTQLAGRRVVGQRVVAAFAMITAYGVWAAQSESAVEPSGPAYDLTMSFAVEGKVLSPRLRLHAGETMTVSFPEVTPAWSVGLTLAPSGNSLMVASSIRWGEDLVAEPMLLVSPGGPAANATIGGDATHPEVRLQISAAATQ